MSTRFRADTRVNRMAGLICKPNPRSIVYEIVARVPEALALVLKKKGT